MVDFFSTLCYDIRAVGKIALYRGVEQSGSSTGS